MLKKYFWIVLTFFMFIYGTAVGNYKIFPFEQIQWIKAHTIGKIIADTNSAHYNDRVELFKLSNPKYPIVMLGDSITEYGNWNELLNRNNILNRGIGGDTTKGVLQRMEYLGSEPQYCFLMIGINDLAAKETVENIFNNYLKIINTLQSKKITPIIQSTLLTNNELKIDNKKVELLNEKIKELSKERNINFIDLNKKLAPNGILLKKYTIDGVHLNTQGYIIWKNELINYIK
jgi:lysophospholipase L1-like esterase